MAAATVRRLLAVGGFVALENAVEATGVGALLPSPLVGMFGLFGVLLCLDKCGYGSIASFMFQCSEPGYRFLFKWAPVFFTPSLIKLPLVEEPITGAEFFRLVVLLFVGALLQMALVATVANFLGSLVPESKIKDEAEDAVQALPGMTPKNAEPYPRPGIPYKRRWLPVYAVIMLAALIFLKLGHQSRLVESAFIMSATLLAFVVGNCAGPTFKTLMPPVFVGVFGGWLAIALWAREDDVESFHDVLLRYSNPGGGGPVLSRLLNPLVISLGLVLFERRHLLQRDSTVIVGTAGIAAVTGLFGSVLLARVLALPKGLAHSTTPRFCQAALALTVAGSLKASPPLAAAIVVSSCSIGVVISKPLMSWLKMEGSRERGLSVGGVAHVLGTVSLASWDKDAVPYAAVCSVLASGFTTALVVIPSVESALLSLLP
eukprot:CAMPEP_0181413074 /NCGR_PEP_ID=MMETSP1110-20121109/8768_1 /TAXON_ID=174948 /ORGANISM="Symbiodinium sp., Strain CCMP421" /LENGTH=430 /DNA_ID=CAMNT_0023535843 /DNA_START=45 /DNA_END=1337 /DNA_ORIENTATION=-